MPKRTNTFQQVVAVIQEHLPGDAKVEESAMVTPLRGGGAREVDVLITTKVKGSEIRIAVEASHRRRKADSPWVEMMIGKHSDLPTDKLVLYSSSGFSKPAALKAQEKGIGTVTAEPISDTDLASSVLDGLPAVWQKTIVLTPERARVWVLRPDGTEVWFKAAPDLQLFLEDAREFPFNLKETIVMRLRAEMPRFVEQELKDIAESIQPHFTMTWRPFSLTIDSKLQELFALSTETDPAALHPIQAIEATGSAVIEVQCIELTHARLGEVRVAFGEMSIGGDPGLVVASDASGQELVTIRLHTGTEHTGPRADG